MKKLYYNLLVIFRENQNLLNLINISFTILKIIL
jgi:hypothetical protein